MFDYIIEQSEGRQSASRDVLTNVLVYYSEAVSTDNGMFRVAHQVVRLGQNYTGNIDPILLEAREEVLLDFGGLRPYTAMQIVREYLSTYAFLVSDVIL